MPATARRRVAPAKERLSPEAIRQEMHELLSGRGFSRDDEMIVDHLGHTRDGRHHLLLTVSDRQFNALCAFDAINEDLEPDHDGEYSLGWSDQPDQDRAGWSASYDDREQDAGYDGEASLGWSEERGGAQTRLTASPDDREQQCEGEGEAEHDDGPVPGGWREHGAPDFWADFGAGRAAA